MKGDKRTQRYMREKRMGEDDLIIYKTSKTRDFM